MKNYLKRAAAAAVAAMIFALSAFPAYAEQKEDTSTETEEEDEYGTYLNELLPAKVKSYKNGTYSGTLEDIVREYVTRTLPYFLMVNNMDSVYDVSDAFRLHNFDGEDNDIFIIIVSESDTMVASLLVGENRDTLTGTFRPENFSEIDSAIANNETVVFGYSNDCFIMYGNKGFQVVENPDLVSEDFITSLSPTNEDIQNSVPMTFKLSLSVNFLYGLNTPGWNTIDGNTYYITSDGTVINKSVIIDDVRYKFTKDGVCHGKYSGFTKSKNGLRYYNDGAVVKNRRIVFSDGRIYIADKDGYLTRQS